MKYLSDIYKEMYSPTNIKYNTPSTLNEAFNYIYLKESGTPNWFHKALGKKIHLSSLTIAEKIRNFLVEKYPDKFKPPTQKLRIEGLSPDISIADVQQYLKQNISPIKQQHNIIINPKSFEILEPDDRDNVSSKFPLLKFNVSIDGNIIPSGIILSGNPVKFGTPVKEGMPAILFEWGVKSQFITGKYDEVCETLHGKKTLLQLLTEISSASEYEINSIKIDQNTLLACENSAKVFLNELKQKHKLMSAFKNQLNDSISTVMTLFDAGITPDNFIYERDELYDYIRKEASNLLNIKYADIWCPADIYIIPKNQYNNIESILQEVLESADPINKLNSLFTSKFKSVGMTKRQPILGISLKQEKSQGGKAKWYLTQLQNKIKGEFNLTKEELSIEDPQYFIDEIKKKIRKINTFVNNNKDLIQYDSTENLNVYDDQNCKICQDIRSIRSKYGAIKVLEYVTLHKDIIVFKDIALASMKVLEPEKTPSFFKIIGNKSGMAKVSSQTFTNVVLDDIITIKNVFNTNAMDITYVTPLKITSDKGDIIYKNYQISIRPVGYDQVTIEGKEL